MRRVYLLFLLGVISLGALAISGCGQSDHFLRSSSSHYGYWTRPNYVSRFYRAPRVHWVPLRTFRAPYWRRPHYVHRTPFTNWVNNYYSCRGYVRGWYRGYPSNCYFPGVYAYYEVASREIDLALDAYGKEAWSAFDDHLAKAQSALPEENPIHIDLEKLQDEKQDDEEIPQHLLLALGKMSKELVKKP